MKSLWVGMLVLMSCSQLSPQRQISSTADYKPLGTLNYEVVKDIQLDDGYQYQPEIKEHKFAGCLNEVCEASTFSQLNKGCHLFQLSYAKETTKFGRPKVAVGQKGAGKMFYRVNDRRVPAGFNGELTYESLEYRFIIDANHEVKCYYGRDKQKDHPNVEKVYKSLSNFLKFTT